MNSCVWATCALGQVRGSVPRRLHQNVNIASIQKIFTTAQSPIRNLHEDEFLWSYRRSGLDSKLSTTMFLDRSGNSPATTSRSARLQRFRVVSRGKMETSIHDQEKCGRPQEMLISFRPPEHFQLHKHHRRASSVRVEDVPTTHNGSTSLRNSDDVRGRRHAPVQLQRTDHLCVDAQ